MKNFICTRPALARQLMDAKQKGTSIVNPWQPQRTAWLFPVNKELCQIVTAFYSEIGKTLPKILQGGQNE